MHASSVVAPLALLGCGLGTRATRSRNCHATQAGSAGRGRSVAVEWNRTTASNPDRAEPVEAPGRSALLWPPSAGSGQASTGSGQSVLPGALREFQDLHCNDCDVVVAASVVGEA